MWGRGKIWVKQAGALIGAMNKIPTWRTSPAQKPFQTCKKLLILRKKWTSEPWREQKQATDWSYWSRSVACLRKKQYNHIFQTELVNFGIVTQLSKSPPHAQRFEIGHAESRQWASFTKGPHARIHANISFPCWGTSTHLDSRPFSRV